MYNPWFSKAQSPFGLGMSTSLASMANGFSLAYGIKNHAKELKDNLLITHQLLQNTKEET